MQKKLIAAAVTALVAGSAFADTTFYGRIDTYVAIEKAATDTNTHVGNGGLGGSFIAVKADEDLGGGMKGYLNWQAQFASDTAVSPAATRYVNVGLDTGATGKLQLGAGFGPMHKTATGFTMTGSPDWTAMNAAGWMLYSSNMDNMVEYMVNAGPVAIDFAYDFSESTNGATVGTKKGNMQLSVNYVGGPLSAALGLERDNGGVVGALTKTDVNLLAAAFDMKVAKVGGVFLTRDAKLNGQSTNQKTTTYEVNVAVPIGNGKVSANFGSRKVKNAEAAKTFGVDYVHNLGKRTFAYVGYGSIDNSANTNFGFTRIGSADEKSSILAAGLRHTF